MLAPIQARQKTDEDYTCDGYDHRNRMTSATTYSSTDVVLQEVEFTYDVFDRRIAKTVDADGAGSGQPETIYTVYDGQHAWADFDESEAVVARYLFGASIDEIVARWQPTEGTAWYLTDHLGTVHDLVETDGDLINTITYDSFGNILSQTDASDGDRFTYTGREYDQELDLYYYRARYYDAQTGRFVSEDPIGFAAGDANFYRYVGNSPTIFTDPMGLMEFAVSDAEARAMSTIRQASGGSSESGSTFSIMGSDAEARAMSTIRQASSGSSESGSTFRIMGSDAEARAMSTIRQASSGSMEGSGSFSRAASDAVVQTLSTIRQASSGSSGSGSNFSIAGSDAEARAISTIRQASSGSSGGGSTFSIAGSDAETRAMSTIGQASSGSMAADTASSAAAFDGEPWWWNSPPFRQERTSSFGGGDGSTVPSASSVQREPLKVTSINWPDRPKPKLPPTEPYIPRPVGCGMIYGDSLPPFRPAGPGPNGGPKPAPSEDPSGPNDPPGPPGPNNPPSPQGPSQGPGGGDGGIEPGRVTVEWTPELLRRKAIRDELLRQQAEASRRNGESGNTDDGGGGYLESAWDHLKDAPGRLVEGLAEFFDPRTIPRDAAQFFDPTTLAQDWQNTQAAVAEFAKDPYAPTARFLDALGDAAYDKLTTPEGHVDLALLALEALLLKKAPNAAAHVADNLPLKKVADFATENAGSVPLNKLEDFFASRGEVPSVIYREGRPSPSNLSPRPQDHGNLSFRDSLSNPVQPGVPGPLGGNRPVLRPGQDYMTIDTSKLPPGSVVPDGAPGSLTTPPGHVSVRNVPPEVLKEAVIPKPPKPPYGPDASGKFPK